MGAMKGLGFLIRAQWMMLLAALMLGLVAPVALAATAPVNGGDLGTPAPSDGTGDTDQSTPTLAQTDNCVPIALPILPGMQQCTNADNQPGIPNNPATGGAIIFYLRYVLQLLSSAVAAIVLLMMIIAGVQYITSGANPGQVKAAKDRLTNALIALVLFFLMFAILQFLIPGGIL